MRRLNCLLAGLLAAGATVIGACAAGPDQPITPVSEQFSLPPGAIALATSNGADVFRVPAMAVTGNGTIVITYDARRGSAADLPNDIDIVERRSTDGGATWSTQVVAVAHSGGVGALANGVGDASLVYDRTTRRLYLFYDFSPARIGIFDSSTSVAASSLTTVHPMLRHSDDNGLTWSAPVDLINQLKLPGMTGIFAGSGHGVQLADGTLVQPYSYFAHRVQRAALAYSTDHGRTWHLSQEIGTHLSENKVVQLDNGTLLDDARPTTPGYRMFSRARCVTCPWSPPAAQAALPDPMANGDLIRVPGHPSWLLESNLDNRHARIGLTIRLSRNDGASWPDAWTDIPGRSGYSVLAALPGGDVAISYETTIGVVFQRFSLCQLTECSAPESAPNVAKAANAANAASRTLPKSGRIGAPG